MDINQAFPSAYLKAVDLGHRKVVVVIDRVELEEVGDEQKPVAYFRGKNKSLPLNKTNANAIRNILGESDTDRWKGRAILIFATKTEYQGKPVDCIRVAAAPKDAKQPAAPPPPEPEVVITDEDVPF